MADVVVEIDEKKLYEAVQDAEDLPSVIGDITNRIIAQANAFSAGFRTGIYHDHQTGETLGDTQPDYGGNVKKVGKTIVGIVHPKNYAAIKDNYENNTLLKSAR